MIDDAASELLKNQTMHASRVQCMAIWNTAREEILFTDSLRGSNGVLDTKSGNMHGNMEHFFVNCRYCLESLNGLSLKSVLS